MDNAQTQYVIKENFMHYVPRDFNQDMANTDNPMRKICICVPTTGLVRIEWMMARFGAIIPVNWSNGDMYQFHDQYSPRGYVVADARNICVDYSLRQGNEWTLFIDHDTCIPNDTFLKLGEYMREKKYPVVCGLYYCKGSKPEPLVFRGRGNGYFGNWKFGDKVMVDAIPMGCTLIHNSILRLMWEESEEYVVNSIMGQMVVRRVFETPRMAWQDPQSGRFEAQSGTEDIPWCDRVMRDKILERVGATHVAKEKYPFLLDTSLFCQHIDTNGIKYPGINYKNYPQYKGSRLEELENGGKIIKARTNGSEY